MRTNPWENHIKQVLYTQRPYRAYNPASETRLGWKKKLFINTYKYFWPNRKHIASFRKYIQGQSVWNRKQKDNNSWLTLILWQHQPNHHWQMSSTKAPNSIKLLPGMTSLLLSHELTLYPEMGDETQDGTEVTLHTHRSMADTVILPSLLSSFVHRQFPRLLHVCCQDHVRLPQAPLRAPFRIITIGGPEGRSDVYLRMRGDAGHDAIPLVSRGSQV